MLICAERQDAANGPGKCFSADCCEGAGRFGFILLLALLSGCFSEISTANSSRLWRDAHWCDGHSFEFSLSLWGLLDDEIFIWESRAVFLVKRSPCQHPQPCTHTHTSTWALPRLDVWTCWLWEYSHWELKCVLFMTRWLFTLSPCICIPPRSPQCSISQPVGHNENSQVVPGGETVEGECVISFQGYM